MWETPTCPQGFPSGMSRRHTALTRSGSTERPWPKADECPRDSTLLARHSVSHAARRAVCPAGEQTPLALWCNDEWRVMLFCRENSQWVRSSLEPLVGTSTWYLNNSSSQFRWHGSSKHPWKNSFKSVLLHIKVIPKTYLKNHVHAMHLK